MRPLGARLLVIPKLQETESKGGLIIPSTNVDKPMQGKVVKVGPGKTTEEGKLLPMNVKPDETILFGKYSGTEVKLDDIKYLILDEEDVLATIIKGE